MLRSNMNNHTEASWWQVYQGPSRALQCKVAWDSQPFTQHTVAFFCFSSSQWIELQLLLLSINTTTPWVTAVPVNKGEVRKCKECLFFPPPSKSFFFFFSSKSWCMAWVPESLSLPTCIIKGQDKATMEEKIRNSPICPLSWYPSPTSLSCHALGEGGVSWRGWGHLAYKSPVRCLFQNQAQAEILPKYHGMGCARKI